MRRPSAAPRGGAFELRPLQARKKKQSPPAVLRGDGAPLLHSLMFVDVENKLVRGVEVCLGELHAVFEQRCLDVNAAALR